MEWLFNTTVQYNKKSEESSEQMKPKQIGHIIPAGIIEMVHLFLAWMKSSILFWLELIWLILFQK